MTIGKSLNLKHLKGEEGDIEVFSKLFQLRK
jgi:hypothetical protein